jgi:hypothetical protein
VDLDEVSITVAYVIIYPFWRVTNSCLYTWIALLEPLIQGCANEAAANDSDFDFAFHDIKIYH